MFASREEVLNGNPQYLREEHEVFVVHKTQPCFDLRNAAAADVETGELKFCGEHALRPAEGIASTADLGTDVVVEPHVTLSVSAFGSLETDARGTAPLAELDQLVCVDFGEQR
jgi:hypothetical protein